MPDHHLHLSYFPLCWPHREMVDSLAMVLLGKGAGFLEVFIVHL